MHAPVAGNCTHCSSLDHGPALAARLDCHRLSVGSTQLKEGTDPNKSGERSGSAHWGRIRLIRGRIHCQVENRHCSLRFEFDQQEQ